MEIYEKLQQLRESKKISRDTMANHLNMSPYNLRNIEYGEVRLTLEVFLQICDYLNIAPLSLIDSKNNYVLLNNEDKIEIENALKVLNKIKYQLDNTSNNNKNISIGNNNNINNSFNN